MYKEVKAEDLAKYVPVCARHRRREGAGFRCTSTDRRVGMIMLFRFRLKGCTQEDLLVYQLIKNADTVGTRRLAHRTG